jgi:hypothetical protein
VKHNSCCEFEILLRECLSVPFPVTHLPAYWKLQVSIRPRMELRLLIGVTMDRAVTLLMMPRSVGTLFGRERVGFNAMILPSDISFEVLLQTYSWQSRLRRSNQHVHRSFVSKGSHDTTCGAETWTILGFNARQIRHPRT